MGEGTGYCRARQVARRRPRWKKRKEHSLDGAVLQGRQVTGGETTPVSAGKKMPRVTLLPSPAIRRAASSAYHAPTTASASQPPPDPTLVAVPRLATRDIIMIAHARPACQVPKVPGGRYRSRGLPGRAYHPPWEWRKASTRPLNKSGYSSISICPASGIA